MLLQFSVKNFKTFAHEAVLSLIASNDDTRQDDNSFEAAPFGLRLLKSAVVYGANASGKTKLIEALSTMREIIYKSANYQSNETFPIEPFRLNTKQEQQASSFEILFIHEGELYRYGFELTKEKVVAEWLYVRPKTKEIELFYREGQSFELHRSKFKVRDLVEKDRIKSNSLLLSVADKENDKIARTVFHWFESQLSILSGLKENAYMGKSIQELQENPALVVDFLKKADLGIDGMVPKSMHVEELPEHIRSMVQERAVEIFTDVWTQHAKFDQDQVLVGKEQFSMDKDESSGTRKFFALSAPVLDALKKGKTLVVDELDAKLHPILVHELVHLFNSKTQNPNNAQLIFNTHDTNLLSSGLFRRDQIWFTEKDRYGAVNLYSLADFKTDTVRKEENFEKNYIKGKYGAIPFLGGWDQVAFLYKEEKNGKA